MPYIPGVCTACNHGQGRCRTHGNSSEGARTAAVAPSAHPPHKGTKASRTMQYETGEDHLGALTKAMHAVPRVAVAPRSCASGSQESAASRLHDTGMRPLTSCMDWSHDRCTKVSTGCGRTAATSVGVAVSELSAHVDRIRPEHSR